jgi:hypothetical protein
MAEKLESSFVIQDRIKLDTKLEKTLETLEIIVGTGWSGVTSCSQLSPEARLFHRNRDFLVIIAGKMLPSRWDETVRSLRWLSHRLWILLPYMSFSKVQRPSDSR